jgi:uncharacterized membrane protein YeaQ/YmgE (transglycosylase-associated protein family)
VSNESLLIFLGTGLIAGFLARLVVGGEGSLIRNLATGVVGSFVGAYTADYFHLEVINNALFSNIFWATLGAIIAVFVARAIE